MDEPQAAWQVISPKWAAVLQSLKCHVGLLIHLKRNSADVVIIESLDRRTVRVREVAPGFHRTFQREDPVLVQFCPQSLPRPVRRPDNRQADTENTERDPFRAEFN
jgi:hypothetical protein